MSYRIYLIKVKSFSTDAEPETFRDEAASRPVVQFDSSVLKSPGDSECKSHREKHSHLNLEQKSSYLEWLIKSESQH